MADHSVSAEGLTVVAQRDDGALLALLDDSGSAVIVDVVYGVWPASLGSALNRGNWRPAATPLSHDQVRAIAQALDQYGAAPSDKDLTVVKAAGSLEGEVLAEFNKKHPRGFGGKFGHKTGPVKATREAIEAGDFRGLKRVGGQLGSNPAALFEDGSGQKWYVKAQRSPEHAANEALASALYRKMYVTTPEVHIGSGAPGLGDGPQTASEWMDVDRPDFADKYFKRDTHGDFGVHAWLANWDVAGMGMDNIAAEKGNTFPVTLDVGGSLLFRAQGGPKGDLFGDHVMEFDTLRDPRYAPTASRLFGDMTGEELAESAERTEKLTPAQIRKLVADYHMPPTLADTLIARQQDLKRRAEQIRLDLEKQTDPHQVTGRAALAAANIRLTDRPANEIRDTRETARFDFQHTDPGWSEAKRQKLEDFFRFYRTSAFRDIGNAVREGDTSRTVTIRDTDAEGNLIGDVRHVPVYEYLAYMNEGFSASPLSQPVQVWRGVEDASKIFGDAWKPDGDMTGAVWEEHSPISTSASEEVARIFGSSVGNGAMLRVHVPAGVGAVQLSGWSTQEARNREAELVLQPHLRLRIVKQQVEEIPSHVAGFPPDKRRVFDVVVEVIPE